MKECKKKTYEIKYEIVEPGTKVHNFLEDSDYVTDEERNIVLTGLKGEKWPVSKADFDKKYDITSEGIAKTKPAQNTIFAEVCKVPQEIKTSWGDTLKAEKGSFIVYNNKNGEPDRNDKWVVDKDVFETTNCEASKKQ